MAKWQLRQVDYQRTNGFTSVYDYGDSLVVAKVDHGYVLAALNVVTRVGYWGPSWVKLFPGDPYKAYISGNRLLLLTRLLAYDHIWGHAGFARMIDVKNGKLLAADRAERAAVLKDGRFVAGLEGYDYFDTWLYGEDGKELDRWRSYGHYVPDPDGTLRVVECDRTTPTHARVARLRTPGRIEYGPRLNGSVSAPVELPDGTIFVLDCGTLRAIERSLDDYTLEEILSINPRDAWRFSSKLTLISDKLQAMIIERVEGTTHSYFTHRWNFVVVNNVECDTFNT